MLGECVLALETLRVGEREYVAADLSVETSDPAYATTRALALVLLCTYVPLFPCCVFAALYRCREHLRSDAAISRAAALPSACMGVSPDSTRALESKETTES